MGNQDAIHWQPGDGPADPTILAISDGHGSAICFRSSTGAELAAISAIRVLTQFTESFTDQSPPQPSLVKRMAEEQLPKSLIIEWRGLVLADCSNHAFTSRELSTVDSHAGAGSAEKLESDPPLAYGATLLVVCITKTYLVCAQLGDGRIVAFSEHGYATQMIPPDERNFAEETTSLCKKEAWQDVQTAFQPVSEASPNLILACTDGYYNSFKEDQGFLKVGGDILQILRSKGLEYVQYNLRQWLVQASRIGSGDDVTVGLLIREPDRYSRRPFFRRLLSP